jgi:Glycosyl transferase family 2
MIRRSLARALDWRFRAVNSRVEDVDRRQHELVTRLEAMQMTLGELRGALLAIVSEEAENRRRLFALRDTPAYDAAFLEPNPLVSITVATHDRAGLLLTRALPSLLAQTHANIEVLVIGDAQSAGLGKEILALGDRRVRYDNLTQRITPHPDPQRHRLIGSTMARNEAQRRARGRWILHFDDDDHLRPDAISSLLELARARRAEVAYGGFATHYPDRETHLDVTFPPTPEQFAFPAALIHAGLGFLERELVAAHLALPGDMYLLTRMLHIGVRFALLERVIFDYYPSQPWGAPPTGRAEPLSSAPGSRA